MEPNGKNIDHAIYIATLLHRLHEGDPLAPDEQEAIAAWQAANGDDTFLQNSKAITDELRRLKNYDTAGAVKTIFGQLGLAVPSRVRRMDTILRWSAVAAMLLVIGAVSVLYFNRPPNNQATITHKPKPILPPGGNKAILTLADGSAIVLDSARNGHLALQGKTNIEKSDGQLMYKNAATTTETLYNTITTPRGGQYAVTLADGSKIWLNAASSLKYPTAFAGTTRQVELTGEAYFEIAADLSKPFKVRLNGMDVQVLGTRFNIKAYQDDTTIRTTLLDGAVKLSAATAGESLLKPGQQATLRPNQRRFTIREVNVNNAVAWRNGYFAFENEDIYGIMKDMSRWYNVDVEFSSHSIESKLGGTLSRYQNAEDVLQVLELTGSVHFSINKKKIIVMP
ncbi:FecR domain-containing protein [Flavitalea sp. BT771]|uniref:FecR family protein n=1 Tax=Flavitalea sp. BT771 TaxID=3063329 RepID=UPI0026E33BC4|nr:FecR family protein [Flavitalea sp. BT771]MDO6433518.1 FecR domain-containing protein [Flavitalea sp. BT771]MDV6222577.1 FecR domain-containing protein [Flavitalea sp. BT771]